MALCEVTGMATISELLGRMSEDELMDWWLYWFHYGDPIARGNIWAAKGKISREKKIRVDSSASQRDFMIRNSR
jgi:hypothetical protein